MSLSDLYQEVIIDHNKDPSNFGELPSATNTARGHNPLCGDQLTIYLQLENNVIQQANFTGTGCAISVASASLLTENIIGKSIEEAQQIFQDVHRMLTEGEKPDDLGKLVVLSGAIHYPARVKCATLAWHTLVAALGNSTLSVTTE